MHIFGRIVKTTALLFCVLFSVARADSQKPRLYYLGSVNESTLSGAFYLHWGYLQHYLSGLESQFQNHFQNKGYDLIVKENANRADLFQALHDPLSAGVFWLSHADPINAGTVAGLSIPMKLLDSSGADVKDLFNYVSPQIQWISVVSCDSNEVLKSENPSPLIHGFDDLTDASKGLDQALTASDAVLKPEINTDCVQELGRSIEITRTYTITPQMSQDSVFPSVTIQYQGKDVAAFQQVSYRQVKQVGGVASETQTVYLPMTKNFADSSSENLLIQSGLNVTEVDTDSFTLGTFTVGKAWSGAQWKMLADPLSGKSLGVTTNQLLYKGSLKTSTSLEKFNPLGCGNQ